MSRTRNDVDIKKGMALLHMGKYTEALAIFEKLKKSFPDDLGLKLDIARCHELKRDFTKANTLYQALLEEKVHKTKIDKILIGAASSYLHQGELNEAKKTYEKIQDKNQENARLFYAKLLEKQKQMLEACDFLATSRISHPNSVQIFIEHEHMKEKIGLSQNRNFDEQLFTAIVASEYKDNLKIQLAYACRLIKNGKIENGLRALEKIVNEQPLYWAARHEYASRLAHLVSLDKATAEFEKIISENPAYWTAYLTYAYILNYYANDKEKCKEILNKVINWDPTLSKPTPKILAQAKLSMSIVFQDEDVNLAIQYARAAIKAMPHGEYAAAWSALGHLITDPVESGKCFEMAYKIDPFRFPRNHGLQSHRQHSIRAQNPISRSLMLGDFIFTENKETKTQAPAAISDHKQTVSVLDEKPKRFVEINLSDLIKEKERKMAEAKEKARELAVAKEKELQAIRQAEQTAEANRIKAEAQKKAKTARKYQRKKLKAKSPAQLEEALPTVMQAERVEENIIPIAPPQQTPAPRSYYKTLGLFAVTVSVAAAAWAIYNATPQNFRP